ncbi:MAG: methyltransferase [Pseudomonadota bacterium]|jgi:SAM-dependent methyltransferase|nr:methyltransferase [Pseudomonadota bacterium]
MQGVQVGYAIYAAVKLGIADTLGPGSMESEELAAKIGGHPRSTFRLLRALVALGLCAETNGRFSLTVEGSCLRTDAPNSVRNGVLRAGGMVAAGWSELCQSIRTGRTFYDLHGHGVSAFDWLARNPNEGRIFFRASSEACHLQAVHHVAAYDFTPFATIMDVGGGEGELLTTILGAAPNSRGILFEQPATLDGARERLTRAGVIGRCRLVGGNFFDGIPEGADLHVMRGVIHDWNDERAVTILRNSRRALRPNGRLLLIDRIMPERVQASAAHQGVTIADVSMLVSTGGCERTEAEFRTLLRQAGFTLARAVPSAPLIEAVPI